MLQLQGINWIIRKTISMTEVTVKMKHFLGINTQTGASVPQITITQSTNMNVNMSGTTENRFLDWSENPQEDHIFGKTVVQSRIIGGQTSSDGISRPFMDVQTSVNDPDIAKFLRGEVDENLQPCSGFLVEPPLKEYHHLKEGHAGVWLNIVIRSQDSKWMAEQVWGFEMVSNERRYTRRVVVSDTNGNRALGRLVYNFVNEG